MLAYTICCLIADKDTKVMILVSVGNAFNCLNRQAEISILLCHASSLSPISSQFFFVDDQGRHILSKDSTTQRDPLAMAMLLLGLNL